MMFWGSSLCNQLMTGSLFCAKLSRYQLLLHFNNQKPRQNIIQPGTNIPRTVLKYLRLSEVSAAVVPALPAAFGTLGNYLRRWRVLTSAVEELLLASHALLCRHGVIYFVIRCDNSQKTMFNYLYTLQKLFGSPGILAPRRMGKYFEIKRLIHRQIA